MSINYNLQDLLAGGSNPRECYFLQLSVDRTEFAKALRLVGRAGKAVRSAEAILTFDDQRLNIDLSGNATQVDANGDWPTEVRLPGDA